jgi:2-methylcitrate synthase
MPAVEAAWKDSAGRHARSETKSTPLGSPYHRAAKNALARSGLTAGQTALSTMGNNGQDLHDRGDHILDLAGACTFEEIAYLLLHGVLPGLASLRAYQRKLCGLRALPAIARSVLESLPASAHPMDVLRTYVSILAPVQPEHSSHEAAAARELADKPLASQVSALLYQHHDSQHGRRIEVDSEDDSMAAHSLHLLHGRPAASSWVQAMHISLNLYAEHEFDA